MDAARELLDSLMGSHRNLDKKQAKAKQGQNFKEANVCKFYLLGFCPQYEDLFHSTKRDIGQCPNVHSEAMKSEFEAHPAHERYRARYSRQLGAYLDDLVRGADEWVARERRNIQQANQQIEDCGPNEIAKSEISKLNDQAKAFLDEAERLAETGSLAFVKEKMRAAEELKEKAKDWEEKARAHRTEDICEVCGSRMESGDPGRARFRHLEGKIHLGYLKIRKWSADLKEWLREYEERRGGGRGSSRGSSREAPPRSRGRGRRSRSRSRSRRGGGAGAEEEAQDPSRRMVSASTTMGASMIEAYKTIVVGIATVAVVMIMIVTSETSGTVTAAVAIHTTAAVETTMATVTIVIVASETPEIATADAAMCATAVVEMTMAEITTVFAMSSTVSLKKTTAVTSTATAARPTEAHKPTMFAIATAAVVMVLTVVLETSVTVGEVVCMTVAIKRTVARIATAAAMESITLYGTTVSRIATAAAAVNVAVGISKMEARIAMC